MMIVRKFALLLLLAITCTGCGESNDEQALSVAVDFLDRLVDDSERDQEQLALQARIPRAIRVQERIDHGWDVYDDLKLTPWMRLRLEFILPAHRAALNQLEFDGLKALRSPLVLWGLIEKQNPNRRSYSPDWSHSLQLEWLDLGTNVTGFYFEIDGGETLEFLKCIDPRDEDFSRLAKNNDPVRGCPFLFSQTVDAPEKDILRLSPELYRTIIEEQNILRVGLILKDGTKTDPGPLAYASDYESVVQKINKEEPPSEE